MRERPESAIRNTGVGFCVESSPLARDRSTRSRDRAERYGPVSWALATLLFLSAEPLHGLSNALYFTRGTPAVEISSHGIDYVAHYTRIVGGVLNLKKM